ncbi:MAG: Antitoxin component YwqK of the YwqJK toxin-antitoxin module [Segetibacter sp.]|nr:Antitoxin component YwqK of the YwqJK toxin-antitoxin module [Segetibacter sp.]
MKPFYLFIFLLFSVALHAQRIEQYYDWQWKRTEPVAARFYAVIEKKDSLWERKDYFIHEKSLQMIGTYTDTSCKIAHGNFQFYHPNRFLESNGQFVNGKKHGLWLTYHANNMMSDSTVYENGNITGTSLSWHSNGFPADSSVYNADGSGVSVSWFDNGVPAAAGRYSTGYKRNGQWQFFHKNGKLSSNEIFENGKLVNKQYFDEEGNALPDTTNRDKGAVFNGGMSGWQKFIYKQLYFPSQYKIVNGDQAVVVVDGVIDEEGNMTEVEVSTPFYPDFDKIAVNALRKSPKWTPAIAHNRKVKYKIRQAVTFQQD